MRSEGEEANGRPVLASVPNGVYPDDVFDRDSQAIFRVRYERFRVRTGSPQTSTYRPTSSPVVIRSSHGSSSLMFMLRGLSLVLWPHDRRNQRAHRASFGAPGQGNSRANRKILWRNDLRPFGPFGGGAGRQRPGSRPPPAAAWRAGSYARGCLHASASSPTHATQRVCWVMYAVAETDGRTKPQLRVARPGNDPESTGFDAPRNRLGCSSWAGRPRGRGDGGSPRPLTSVGWAGTLSHRAC